MSRNRGIFAIGMRNQDLEFVTLGFSEQDGQKRAVDLFRYYDKIITDSGMKPIIYGKTRNLVTDSDATQRPGSADENFFFTYSHLKIVVIITFLLIFSKML